MEAYPVFRIALEIFSILDHGLYIQLQNCYYWVMGQLILILICLGTALLSSSLVFFFVFPSLTGIKLTGPKIIGGLIFAPLQGVVTVIAFGIALYFSTVISIFTALGGGVAAVPMIFTLSLGFTAAILFLANLALISFYKSLGIIEINAKYAATKAILILMVSQVISCVAVTFGAAPFVKFDNNFTPFEPSYSFIDTKGNVAIDEKFSSASPFKNGIAEVQTRGRESYKKYIDRTGKTVAAPKEEKPKRKNTFDDDPALYESKGPRSLDPDFVIETQVFQCIPFSEGLALARKKWTTDWGFVDPDFQFKIAPKFSDARHFKDGLAAVCVDSVFETESLWGFIDKSGNYVIPPKFISAECFSDGLSLVCILERSGKNKKYAYGYIDKTGKFVIKPKYVEASSFSEGLAVVRQ